MTGKPEDTQIEPIRFGTHARENLSGITLTVEAEYPRGASHYFGRLSGMTHAEYEAFKLAFKAEHLSDEM